MSLQKKKQFPSFWWLFLQSSTFKKANSVKHKRRKAFLKHFSVEDSCQKELEEKFYYVGYQRQPLVEALRKFPSVLVRDSWYAHTAVIRYGPTQATETCKFWRIACPLRKPAASWEGLQRKTRVCSSSQAMATLKRVGENTFWAVARPERWQKQATGESPKWVFCSERVNRQHFLLSYLPCYCYSHLLALMRAPTAAQLCHICMVCKSHLRSKVNTQLIGPCQFFISLV